jgi:hypothetical protein
MLSGGCLEGCKRHFVRGFKPALGIPRCLTREAVRNWTEYEHYSAWKDLPGQRHGKLFIGKPCKKKGQMTCSN